MLISLGTSANNAENTPGRLSSNAVTLAVTKIHKSYSLYVYTPPKLEKACTLKRQKNQP